ncbi:MAG: hypothetical protein HQK53_14915 [Oligoflexia bacterium]|nr:hypothetical protein [Oligoflexia bacterium]
MLKKPCNLTGEEKIKIQELEVLDNNGFVKRFRVIIKNIVNLFDKSETELSAKQKFKRLKEKIDSENNKCYSKIINFFEEHWEEAMQYLINDENRGRASNSESGMRLLRRLEKNHDGIRSAATRKHYIKIYQTIKYFHEDVADFIGKSTQLG